MKRRGSVMIFAVVLIASMTTVICATVWLSSSIVKDERIYEDQIRTRYAIDAVTEQAAQDFTLGTMGLPATRTPSVSGVTCSVTATDNNANIPHTISIVTAATYHGRTLTETRIVGARKAPSPFYYALFVNGNITSSTTFVTGSSGSNGDVFAKGSISFTGTGNTVNGDLESTSTQSLGTTSVTGTLYPSTTTITYPSVVASNYSSVANQSTSSGTINGATFSTTSGAYYLIYASNSNVTISGTFTGKGTIFASGNVTISGPITMGNSSSRIAIIAAGNLSFTSTGPHNGYFYGGTCTLPTGGITISKGSLVVNSLTTTNQPITITNDPSVWLSSTEGTNHRLPGYFP